MSDSSEQEESGIDYDDFLDFLDDDEQFAARYGDVRRSSSGNVLHHTSDTTNRNRRAARKADKGDPSERSRSKARNSGSKANRAARRSISVTRGEPGRTSPGPAPEVDWSGRLAPGYANMDPAVLRQIEKDLNKLARRRNERERAKQAADEISMRLELQRLLALPLTHVGASEDRGEREYYLGPSASSPCLKCRLRQVRTSSK